MHILLLTNVSQELNTSIKHGEEKINKNKIQNVNKL